MPVTSIDEEGNHDGHVKKGLDREIGRAGRR
jgi:hypothetical protein